MEVKKVSEDDMISRWARAEEQIKNFAKLDKRKTVKLILMNYMSDEMEESTGKCFMKSKTQNIDEIKL